MADEVIQLPLDRAAMLDLAGFFVRQGMETPRDNRKIRASGAGHCPRKIGYQILGYPGQPNTAHQEFTFWQGHALGDHMTLVLIKMGWVKAEPFINDNGELDFRGNTEEEIEDDYFKGHYDIFTEPLKRTVKVGSDGNEYNTYAVVGPDDPDGKRYLLDFKTMSDRISPSWQKDDDFKPKIEFKKSVSGIPYIPLGKTPLKRDDGGEYGIREEASVVYPGQFTKLSGFPIDYWQQLHIYARAKKADGLMLMVMAKDAEPKVLYQKPDFRPDHLLNFPVKVFTTDTLDQKTLDDLDAKARMIYSYTEKGEVPPIPVKLRSKGDAFPCAWCSHQHHCRPEIHKERPGLSVMRPIALEGFETKIENTKSTKPRQPLSMGEKV